jgi:hypothetical protein
MASPSFAGPVHTRSSLACCLHLVSARPRDPATLRPCDPATLLLTPIPLISDVRGESWDPKLQEGSCQCGTLVKWWFAGETQRDSGSQLTRNVWWSQWELNRGFAIRSQLSAAWPHETELTAIYRRLGPSVHLHPVTHIHCLPTFHSGLAVPCHQTLTGRF